MDFILKRKITFLFNLCEKLEEIFTMAQITNTLKNYSLKIYCNAELLHFIVFLAEYNNNLKKEAIECINYYLDWDFQIEDRKELVRNSKDVTNNIIEMGAEGLIIIKSFVFAENAIFDTNISTDTKLLEIYLDVL